MSHSEFAKIYTEFLPGVWRALRHLGVQEKDLEDQTQEVFIVALRKLPTFEGRSSLRTWVYGICLRVAAAYRRSPARSREIVGESYAERHTSETPETALELRESARLLAHSLSTLTHEQREVFVLYEIEELSMSEIVTILGCPAQTAYSRLHAARKTVQQMLHSTTMTTVASRRSSS